MIGGPGARSGLEEARVGYVNMQGSLGGGGAEQEIRRVAEVMREKDIYVMGRGKTQMDGWGEGCDINRMEWVAQGTQHKSAGVGFLIKEGVGFRVFQGEREGWLQI